MTTKDLNKRLEGVLYNLPLEELPLDYIETIFFSDLYVYYEILGAGSFGVVIRANEISTNIDYAIKVFFTIYIRLFHDSSLVQTRLKHAWMKLDFYLL